ncbi:uncharacterized protein RAG0_09712 [Rhynchosporium agropyri]|uniref:Uncharacterized protein n=1 Tax=Rhynchosporium agropyri TaxID=914238 RepID=A0A1E1KWT0_9HELO|nr:uncharacterized protein RAG0_09712 [Rhynchosporium agropyri]
MPIESDKSTILMTRQKVMKSIKMMMEQVGYLSQKAFMGSRQVRRMIFFFASFPAGLGREAGGARAVPPGVRSPSSMSVNSPVCAASEQNKLDMLVVGGTEVI